MPPLPPLSLSLSSAQPFSLPFAISSVIIIPLEGERIRLTYEFIFVRFPRQWLRFSSIEFVIKKTKRFLATESISGEHGTVSDCKFNFYVNPIGWTSFYERRRQPVVDRIVRHVAHNMRSPIDSFFEICKTFFYPLKQLKTKTKINY